MSEYDQLLKDLTEPGNSGQACKLLVLDAADAIRSLKDERDAWKHKAELYEKSLLDRHGGEPLALLDELDAARAERDALRKGIKAVEDLINDSSGVAGLHLNGDYASWESLRTGGHFEEWLIDFDNALAAIEKGETDEA